MAKRKYSPETRAAVMAELLAGQSTSFVAERYQIPEGTIKAWNSREAGATTSVATEKRVELAELILTLLSTELNTLQRIATHATDEAWLAKQGAAELATFYGVMQDKVFRKLEALKRASADD